ncbi:MAG: AMP phosphorylase [Candidatus Nanohaloarchaea archaeon]|nr:AMP phosphorylase [Candidatus Nanohaloarchaea archaeon]
MQLNANPIDMEAKTPTVIMNQEDAAELGVYTMDRVRLNHEGGHEVAVVETTNKLVDQGNIGLTNGLHALEGDIDVEIASKPESVKYIKAKMDGREWEEDQIYEIVDDIDRNALSDIEMGAYVSTIYTKGLSMEETAHLTQAMVDAGEQIQWDHDILADKHSIGGVPGNRVTPIIIPIIAAAGINIPKTSSRAITSPAGTADTMEVFCDVEFDLDEIKQIVNETNGCLVWGGSVKLSPVDDDIIRAEHPLSLDPEGQVVASVLSKKKSAGSNHVVIDIPYGEGSKVGDLSTARELAEKFKRIGDYLDMAVECTITRGDQPIGRGMGPALEAKDCLKVLKGDGPKDLEVKAVRLANILLEMCGESEKALHLIHSGEALEKFREIIGAQNGDQDIEPEDIEVGEHTLKVHAENSGIVSHIDNEQISDIASRAGAPKDNGAGAYLHKKKGDRVKKGEALMTVYAEKQNKLAEAEKLINRANGYRVHTKEEMLIEEL